MKIIVFLLLLINIVVFSADAAASDFEKAWKPDASKWSFDPSSWDAGLKQRMMQVGSGVVYASSLGCSIPIMGSLAVFLFGLVKLSWPLVGSTCLGLYGWRTGKKSFLLAGAVATYAMAFGVSFF